MWFFTAGFVLGAIVAIIVVGVITIDRENERRDDISSLLRRNEKLSRENMDLRKLCDRMIEGYGDDVVVMEGGNEVRTNTING